MEISMESVIKIEDTHIGGERSDGTERPVKREKLEVNTDGCPNCTILTAEIISKRKRIKTLDEENGDLSISLAQYAEENKKIGNKYLTLQEKYNEVLIQNKSLQEHLSKAKNSLECTTIDLNKSREKLSLMTQKYAQTVSIQMKEENLNVLPVRYNQNVTEMKRENILRSSGQTRNSRVSVPPFGLLIKTPRQRNTPRLAKHNASGQPDAENQPETTYTCEMCRCLLPSLHDLLSHRGQCVKEPKPESTVETTGVVSLSDGTQEIPPKPVATFLCPVCNRTFSRACALASHQRVHKNKQRLSSDDASMQKQVSRDSRPATASRRSMP